MNVNAGRTVRARSRGWGMVGTSGGLLLALAVQWLLVTTPAVEVEQFDRWAVELERSGSWRYGYVQGHHGATLVRAPLRADAPPSVSRTDDPIATAMDRELRTAPWKAGLELVFYAGLLALCRAGRRRLNQVRSGSPGRWRRVSGVALTSAVLVSAAMAPYLVAGYGEPLFSTHQGPGALISSGLVPITAPITRAVSYGLLLQSALIWPLMATQWAAEPLSAWLGIRGSLWFVAAGFWSLASATWVWIAHLNAPATKQR